MFPEGGASTGELFLGWSALSVVTPSVTFYYDVDEIDDYHLSISLVPKDFGAIAIGMRFLPHKRNLYQTP
jgi:hypothetical protein